MTENSSETAMPKVEPEQPPRGSFRKLFPKSPRREASGASDTARVALRRVAGKKTTNEVDSGSRSSGAEAAPDIGG